MNENNQELNQENVEEIFEMEELTEFEEKDLTGGASAGKGGYSTFIINLPIRPLEVSATGNIKNASIQVHDNTMFWTHSYHSGRNAVILKARTRGHVSWAMHGKSVKYTISYYGVDHVSHNISGIVRF